MAVIIRLQNLPLSADSVDIRDFFKGLKIPEGGVHIVGGEFGDAFIGFATDEDARQAMNLNNKKIKDSRIKLLLSSRNEMQNVILAARERQAKLIAAALNQNNTDNGSKGGTTGNASSTKTVGAAKSTTSSSTRRGSPEKPGSSATANKRGRGSSRERRSRSPSGPRDRRTAGRYNRSRSRSPIRSDKTASTRYDNSSKRSAIDDYKSTNNNATSSSPKVGYVTSSNASTNVMPNAVAPVSSNTNMMMMNGPQPVQQMVPGTGSTLYNAATGQLPPVGVVGLPMGGVAPTPGVMNNMFYPSVNQQPATSSMYPPNMGLPGAMPANAPLPTGMMTGQGIMGAPAVPNNYGSVVGAPGMYNNQMPGQQFNVNQQVPNGYLANQTATFGGAPGYMPQQQQSPFVGTGVNGMMMPVPQYLEVRNLPPTFNADEAAKFFSDVAILGIEDVAPIINDKSRLLLRVATDQAFQGVLSKNGSRYLDYKNRLEIVPSSYQAWMINTSPHGMMMANNNLTGFGGPMIQSNPFQPNNGASMVMPNFMGGMPAAQNQLMPQIDGSGMNMAALTEGWCARLSNLSFDVRSDDIQDFFRRQTILNLHIEYNKRGRLSGDAYIEFGKKSDYDKALTMHRMRFLGRHIFIEPVEKKEVIERVRDNLALMRSIGIEQPHRSQHSSNNSAPNNSNNQQNMLYQSGGPVGSNTMNVGGGIGNANNVLCAIHINGLPSSVRISDIIAHLTPFNFNPKEIHILRKNGTPIGQAFIEFFTPAEVERSLGTLNGSQITPNAPPLSVVGATNIHEVRNYLTQFDHINWLESEPHTPNNMDNDNENHANLINTNKNNNDNPTPSNTMSQANMRGGGGAAPSPNMMAPNAGPPYHMHPPPHSQHHPGGMRYPGGPPMRRPPPPHGRMPPNMSGPRRPFARITFKNLPPSITADEVIELCKPFGCIASTLQLPHTSEGRPTGEAIIGFPDEFNAKSAIDKLNNTKYGDSKITVGF